MTEKKKGQKPKVAVIMEKKLPLKNAQGDLPEPRVKKTLVSKTGAKLNLGKNGADNQKLLAKKNSSKKPIKESSTARSISLDPSLDVPQEFTQGLAISFGGKDDLVPLKFVYTKQLFRLPDEKGTLVEQGLRYGENPDQKAVLYRLNRLANSYGDQKTSLVSGLADMSEGGNMIYGARKHPSKTNLTDVDSALVVLKYLSEKPAAVIVKHNNPSGVAWEGDITRALIRAWEADRVAAFGGVAVLNRSLDRSGAEFISEKYLEVVAAPEFEEGVLEILLKKPDLRIFRIPNILKLKEYEKKRHTEFRALLDGGLIVQHSQINAILSPSDFKPARAIYKKQVYEPSRKPTKRELADLYFGWAVEQAVVSNSVLFAKDGATVSIAGGQQDRVGVVEIAVSKAYRNYCEAISTRDFKMSFKELELKVAQKIEDPAKLTSIWEEAGRVKAGLKGAVMVSDAFFPFRDAVDVALAQGISAIVHPGGSLRDWESIKAVNEAKPPVAMVFTGQRVFKH